MRGRIRPALSLAICLLSMEAAALSPLPFFQRIERVGLLCAVDADAALGASPDAADLGEDTLCGRAAALLSEVLVSGPPVTTLAPNDARIADPGTLLVLLHATLRPEGDRRLLALAATLQRAGSAGDAPFFMTPPQALAMSGKLDESSLNSMLERLFSPLARALRSSP
ncbi:hypothetical protein AZL_f00020 (plasmid) [Azospirillum sp. B510]|uniref:hypothetical protein n=1 Tax=Azospirillum sp. (strain B510) TaxID=137722 RepID=UPI0001C4CEE2|nr:hypothetical protein [Azospirillum sp. B510]BAI76762.1 hypothetical protein AZL_f00020 [Azospirillum sp. B510]